MAFSAFYGFLIEGIEGLDGMEGLDGVEPPFPFIESDSFLSCCDNRSANHFLNPTGKL